jgi:regulatory protein
MDELEQDERKLDAVELALRALRYRDLSELELDRKLAARGVAEGERAEALATLRRTGLLDETRYAQARAAALVSRGSGDALVRDTLERAGLPRDVVEATLDELEPERERARRLVERRGATPKTARYLGAKGFSADTIAEVADSEGGVARESWRELG